MLTTIRNVLGGTMRRTAIAVTTALLAATLTACGSDSSSEATASPSPSASVEAEATFLDSVTAAGFSSWSDSQPTDEELVAYPPQWCSEFDADHSVKYVLDDPSLYPIGHNWGTALPDAQQLVVLAVKAYCPEHQAMVVEELKESGAY
ncbi:hypothetical protein GCM10010381_12460 [Streptomyces xantholiticus]|nr:hypothetical protein GCM10010381_12460 [Streptomyces xantholiticus]